jgi:hypothetical protein
MQALPGFIHRTGSTSMNALRAIAHLVALTLLPLAGLSLAADPNVVVSVSAAPPTVTFSRPFASPALPTYAAYTVTIANNGSNTLNNVVFTGATSVALVNGPSASAPFFQSNGLACQTTIAGPTSIACPIGQLRAGGDSRTFTVLFSAPVQGTLPVPADAVNFTWAFNYAEGPNDNPGASHQDTQVGTTITALGTPTDSEVKSFVPAGGATIFTGLSGVATAADPWTTTVAIPSLAVATVVESVLAQSCSADLLVCNASELTIPGSFAQLVITLRRDKTTIKPGAKISNAEINYAQDGVNFTPVQSCDVTGGPAPGVPCLASRKAYTKKNAPGAEWIGDWEFIIFALDNGQYRG